MRAGRHAIITTRPHIEPPSTYRLEIDWRKFDSAGAVDEVPLSIQTQERITGDQSGTEIKIERLSRTLGRREVKKLSRSLVLLADPFGTDPSGFAPTLDSPEFQDLAELVSRKYFDSAEYHLHTTIDASGYATARVTDWLGGTLFATEHADLRRLSNARDPDQPYRCPPARFDLWIFILSGRTFQTRKASLGAVREWLQTLGGVMLYRNGLRVSPYGDAGNDWLDMNLQRARSPEERPSTNTSLGQIRVDDRTHILQAKTDRSGLIETAEFQDLRQMARDSLDWLANQRLKVAEARRASRKASAPFAKFAISGGGSGSLRGHTPAAPGAAAGLY